MRYKYLLLAICPALIGILIYVNESSNSPITTATQNADVKPVKNTATSVTAATINTSQAAPKNTSSSLQIPKPTHIDIEERIEAMQKRRPDQTYDPVVIVEAVKRDAAWGPTNTIPKHLPLRPDEFTDGRQFIQFDSLKMETLMVGDSIKLNINEVGKNYEIVIDSVEKNDYDSVSWFGHLEGEDGQTYSVSFTRGKELTVSGIDTPEGHYVLQAHGNDGWIASSKLLFKVDSSSTDAVNPLDEEHENH